MHANNFLKKLNLKALCSGLVITALGSLSLTAYTHAAIALDRTRIIYNGGQKSVSLSISNKNKQLPYLAQAWIENSAGEKITTPFAVLPPLQRLEPEKSSQIRVEALPAVQQLPQDRESIFYFNLREIPPKSEKANVLQLALQSKIKLFYRPKALFVDSTALNASPWQEKLELIKQGNDVIAKNPTGYYTTILGVEQSEKGPADPKFKAVMIPPFSEQNINISASWLGSHPVLTYINDYGGRPKMQYQCQANQCTVVANNK